MVPVLLIAPTRLFHHSISDPRLSWGRVADCRFESSAFRRAWPPHSWRFGPGQPSCPLGRRRTSVDRRSDPSRKLRPDTLYVKHISPKPVDEAYFVYEV